MDYYLRQEVATVTAHDIMSVLANGVHDAEGRVSIRYEVAAPTWMINHCGALNPNAEIRVRALQGHNCRMRVKTTKLPEASMFGPGDGKFQDAEGPWKQWQEPGRKSAASSWDPADAIYKVVATQPIIPILAATTVRVRSEELSDHTADMRMKTVFHSTPFVNCRSIIREGLQSCWEEESRNLHCTTSEEIARHHAKPGDKQGLARLNQHVLGLLAQLRNLHVVQVILSPTVLMASNYGDHGNDRHRRSTDLSWGSELDLKALPNFVGVAINDDWFSIFA